ncbi:MAG: hypothetical protein IJW24_02885 [Clostridia bacterium]|nr:hypothetical protein [Clostridia bacterium]
MENVITKDKTGNELGKAFLFSGLVMIIGALAWGFCYYTGFLSSWVECIATII